jgi:hypothetical protein
MNNIVRPSNGFGKCFLIAYIAFNDFKIGMLRKTFIAKKHEIINTDRIPAIQEHRNKDAAFVASASCDKNSFHGVDREIGIQKLHDFPKMPR